MLAGTPGGVGHDDSVNQRNDEGGRLNVAWGDTKALWAREHGDDEAAAIDKPGVT